jgi:hypothetical protein
MLALCQYVLVAPLGSPIGPGIEDGFDLPQQPFHLGASLGVVRSVRLFGMFTYLLPGVEYALVVDSPGEDLSDDIPVVRPHISDHHAEMIPFGPQG